MSWTSKLIRYCFYSLFFLTPLFFTTFTSELFEFNKIILVYGLTIIVTTCWSIKCIFHKKFIFHKTSLDIPLLLFLGSQFISLVFSIDHHISWFGYYSRFNGGLLSILCYSLLYWAFVTFIDKKTTEKILQWALVSASLVAIYGILEHFGIDAKYWVQDVKNRVFSTLGQPNWLAAYIVALIFIPLSKITNLKKLFFHYSVFILLFVCLLFTKSRSGLLAFGVSSVIFWSYQIFRTKKYQSAIIFASLLLIILPIIKTPIRDFVLSKLHRPVTSSESSIKDGPALETGGTESGEIRKIVWKGALKIWLDGPKNFWFGSGPETFAMAYYSHRPIEHNNTSEWELLYNKAHNEFLNFLATTGLVGLLGYLFLLLFSGVQLFKSKNVALLAGWLSLSVTNFWGFSVVITQIFLFLFPAIAITLNTKYEPLDTKHKHLSIVQIILLIFSTLASGVILISLARYYLADLHYSSAQKHLVSFSSSEEGKDILTSYQEYAQAYSLNANEPTIASDFSIAAAYMSILARESDATSAANLANLAQTVADQAIHESPSHPNFYKSKARMYLVLAVYDETFLDKADAVLAQAALLSPTDPRIPYNRSLVAKYKEDKVAQIKFLKEAVALRSAYQAALDALIASDSSRPK